MAASRRPWKAFKAEADAEAIEQTKLDLLWILQDVADDDELELVLDEIEWNVHVVGESARATLASVVETSGGAVVDVIVRGVLSVDRERGEVVGDRTRDAPQSAGGGGGRSPGERARADLRRCTLRVERGDRAVAGAGAGEHCDPLPEIFLIGLRAPQVHDQALRKALEVLGGQLRHGVAIPRS